MAATMMIDQMERGFHLVREEDWGKHRGSSGILLTARLVSILISEMPETPRSSHLMSQAAFP